MNTPAPWSGPAPDARMRLSDDERDAAAAELGEHYAQGRLTREEFDERTERIWSAKTRGEVPGLFADLPSRFARPVAPAWTGPRPAPRPAPRGPGRRGARRGYLVRGHRVPTPLMVLLVILGVGLVLAHLPLVLFGLLIWFLVSRSRCRSGQAGPHPPASWSHSWPQGRAPGHW